MLFERTAKFIATKENVKTVADLTCIENKIQEEVKEEELLGIISVTALLPWHISAQCMIQFGLRDFRSETFWISLPCDCFSP